MPQQPFVMRVHFYHAQGQGLQGLQSGAHHVSYMGSAKKDELLVDDESRSTLESAAIHARYAGERPGNMMGYLGSLASDPQAAQKSILQAQGPVWRVILSVGEADALAMGGNLTTKAGWEQAANTVVPQMVKQLGLDPDKVQWIAAAHRHQHHENNPHLHLLVWEEGEPSRKTAKWTDKERRAIRKDWVSALYAPERAQLGKEKNQARQDARTLIQAQLSALKEAGNGTQGFQQELTTRLQQLGQQLPGHGRLAYAFMPPETKQEVNNLIHWLWDQDPSLKAAHDRYLQSAEAMGTFYWHQDPNRTQDSPAREQALQGIRDRAEADLIGRLAGPVLKVSQNLRRQVDRDEYREASASARTFLRDGNQAERLQPWIERLQLEGPSDEALKDLVIESRTWEEREQWLRGWLESGELSEHAADTGGRAWDTVVQSVVQGLARQRQRETLQTSWDAALAEHPEIGDQLWTIAAQYAQSSRKAADWQEALKAYQKALPPVAVSGGDLAVQKFERHLAHHVQWLDEERAVDDSVTRQDLLRFRMNPDAVIQDLIARSPELQKMARAAAYAVRPRPEPFTYRYAHESSQGDWSFTERTFREGSGPLLRASPVGASAVASPLTLTFPSASPPPGVQATAFDPQARTRDQEAAQGAFRERVSKHLMNIGYQRGVYRRQSLPNLSGVLHRIMRDAERDAARTAAWLAESEYQRKSAEIAMAQSTGQELAL
jgi:hypothetical protein